MSGWEKATEIILKRVSEGLLTTVLISADIYWRLEEDPVSDGTVYVDVEVFDKTERLYSFSYTNKIKAAASKYHMGYDFVEYLRDRLATAAEVVEDEVVVSRALYAIGLEIRPRGRPK